MRRTIVYLLIATLLLTLTGCGLSKNRGFGDLIILGDNITREDGKPLTSGATVTINNETKSLGEKFSSLPAGTYDAKTKDENFEATFQVKVEVNKEVTLSPQIILKQLANNFNAWKFTFDPTKLAVDVTTEAHLVGDLPGVTWKPDDIATYRLIKQTDGTWSAIFAVEEGKEFKIIFDDTGWNDKTNVGTGGLGGGNFNVGSFDDQNTGVKVEPVLAWKFIFKPSNPPKWDVTVNNEVHLVGPFTNWKTENKSYSLIKQSDGTWSALFEMDEGTEFKFIFDGESWANGVGPEGVDKPGNFIVGQHTDVVTKDF